MRDRTQSVDLGPLRGGAAAGPGFVQTLEGEQPADKLLLEDGEAFCQCGRRDPPVLRTFETAYLALE